MRKIKFRRLSGETSQNDADELFKILLQLKVKC